MPPPVSQDAVIRFGVFEADLRSSELRKCGVRVKIQELPFQALRLLVSHPNEIINRDQLRSALWPDDVFVDFDRGIISAINRLRDALGDSAENPVFIETVGRRGYRWIVPTYCPEPVKQKTASLETEDLPETAPSAENTQFFATRSKWILILPVLALVSMLAVYASHRAAHGEARPASSLSSLGLPNSGSARHAANPEAEDFYLKGRFFWNQRTPDSLNKALDSFMQAIVHDPGYAPAYVGLADCYNLLREYSVMPPSEAYPRALAAAKKAVELDDLSSEAHASLAFAAFNGMWDVATSDREFRRALELDPKNGIAHHWYATTLLSLGRLPEALMEIERAQALDPASKSILADKGRILWEARRQDEGLALLKQMEAAEPEFRSPHRYLELAYRDSGDYPNYLKETRQVALLIRDNAALAVAEAAARGYASGGARGMFLEQLREQKKLYALGQVSPMSLAETSALLGNKQEALGYLQAAYAKHVDDVGNIKFNRNFESLHGDPEFQQLTAKIGSPTPY